MKNREILSRISLEKLDIFPNSVLADLGTKGSRWSSRRRDSKLNGADLYVARITKTGCGNARPCWRCLEWCRWAGVKRIFHWNEETSSFNVVKVNSASIGVYETHADTRLFAGLVSSLPRVSPCYSDGGPQGW